MLRKISMFAFLIAVTGLFTAFTTPKLKTTTINTAKSSVKWKGYKVTGSHYGSIDIKNGTLQFDKKTLVGGSFEMDMTSIVVEDIKGNGAAKLEGHLKSEDFFGVDKYNTASFKITSANKTATKGQYNVTGDMTIKNTTSPVSFVATLGESAATATIKIDRSKFNVRYRSKSFFNNLGDKTIYDEFELQVSLAY